MPEEFEYILKDSRTGNKHRQAGVSSRQNTENNKHKAIDALQGILEGILADKIIKPEEIGFVHKWLKKYAETWPECPLSGVFLCLRDELSSGKLGKKQIVFLEEAMEKARSARRTFLFSQDSRIDVLQGVIKGVLSDRELNEKEIKYLKKWISERTHRGDIWPFSEIRKEFKRLSVGKEATPEGLGLILKYLNTIIGEQSDKELTSLTATKLPIDDPPPTNFPVAGTTFVLTGMFRMGARTEIVERIKSLGGVYKGGIVRGSVLVVGDFASRDWKYSAHGIKIEKAVEYRNKYKDVKIISETFFESLLPKGSS